MTDCWILLKWSERPSRDHYEHVGGDVTVHSVHLSEQSVVDRVALISKANSQYPTRQIGTSMHWVVGPTEDEGFFGNAAVHLRAAKATLPELAAPDARVKPVGTAR